MSSVLGFYGGVGSVTGANFLLDTGSAAFLVDCGMIQGDRFQSQANKDPFVYNPADIDVLLVTHAHADHIGRIPKLVKDGFKGVIYSTTPTLAFATLMFRDAYKIMLFEEERYGNERLYEEKDIGDALSLWKTVSYNEAVTLPGDVTGTFTDAGHILGSAMVSLKREGKKIVFTGDIGNIPQPLLNPPVIPKDYDYLLMESVYGDRQHEEVAERTELLKYYIEDTRKKNGTLIIPAFSLERTQGMLFEINNLVESGEIEPLPVFLDSPLAISVTAMYRKYTEYLKDEIQEQIKGGDDIFAFEGLSFTPNIKDSREIAKTKGAKIIIAGSGMSHGGRILGHEKRYLEDKSTTLLLVGYQAVGSMGRLLHDGAKKVKIDKEDVHVRARVARIRGYSGHADRDQLIDLVAQGGDKAKQIFVTMGEERSSLFLVQRLRDYLGLKAVAPSLNEEIEIDF
ncbi:MBL fold metallo-hydrolase [Candidatus Pacebacteria bacterium]|nr:MBL fold metallo-hydrolase [Candidatus Paceibacterota bacterium]